MSFAREITRLLSLSRSKRRRLVLILGAEVSKLTSIRHPKVIFKKNPRFLRCQDCAHSTKEYEQQRATWSEFEYHRMFSRNVLPEFAYYFIAKFCSLGLVRSILTTNYDSFLWSIFSKDSKFPKPLFNPVLNRNENDPFGYLTHKDSKKVGIFYLHGTFDWGQFKNCGCLVNLPPWAVGTNLWSVQEDWGGVFLHDFQLGHNSNPTGPVRHYTDWKIDRVDRSSFSREITAAKRELAWAIENNGLLLLLGFTGTYSHRLPGWHEEISEKVAAAARRIPTFMVITSVQAEKCRQGYPSPDDPTSAELSWLLNQVQGAPFGETMVVNDINRWFIDSLQGTEINPSAIEDEYEARWVNRTPAFFLTPTQFKGR